jgi:asparagine synthase (glutamine-hydrolysing)
VAQLEGEPRPVVAREVLDRMTDAMTHRGPNDRGTYSADGIALGVRRLSIVDVEGGHQPFPNETRTIWAIQNGELYNHAGLRDDLAAEGHRFESRCDTEIIPHLYERFGPSFPEQLRGMFGLAVWDGERRRAVIARDRLGIKPLYYARAGDLLVFGSELKSVLASGLVETELDYDALDMYLTFGFFPGPWTPLAGVAKLMPGQVLITQPGGVRIERFWRYPQPDADRRLSLEEASAGLLAELEESVRLRLMSDVPLGVMLSGGLDSSLVAALMARNMTEPVKTFSIGFAEDGVSNELADAREVAELLGAEHHELELSYHDREVDLAELLWHMDEPVADLSALGFHAISELASRHVTVALSGQGADELLGGYTKHRAASLVGMWQRLPGPAARAGASLALKLPASFQRAARTLAARDPAERLVAMSGRVDQAMRAELFDGPLAELDGRAARRAVLALADGVPDDPLPTTLFIDGQLALVDDMLHYFDRASMAHSLEVRVPFLDHHVVEYCARIPGNQKVHRLNTKHVLKQAARGLVPDRIVDKRKLGFFRAASVDWLRAQMSGVDSDYLLGPAPLCTDFLAADTLRRLVAEHRAGRETEHVHLLISILLLEMWLQTYLPRATARPAAVRELIHVSR